MWKGVGRSGIGDQAIIGEYDDWSGLSMNGRQFKNPLTLETRDLSGADYWHQRKALEPKTLEDIPTYVNGRPNIQAFAEPITKPKAPAKKKTAFQSISLADSNYERLCGLSDALDTQLDNGELSFEDWTYARRQIDQRLAKAWSRLCKARNWDENGESLDNSLEHELTFSLEDVQEARDVGEKQRVKRELTGNEVFDSLSETNVFLGLFIKVKKIMKIMKALNNWEK